MIYAIIILVLIVSVYALGNCMLYTLPLVEAGPISGVKRTGLSRTNGRIKAVYKKTINGIEYKYRTFIVQGKCMDKIGIKPNDLVSVKMLSNTDKKTEIKPGTPVLIFLNDKKFRGYKIRIIKEFFEDEKAKTFYYNEDGSEHESSEPHTLSAIIGIVEQHQSDMTA